jgi:hypothetical protein
MKRKSWLGGGEREDEVKVGGEAEKRKRIQRRGEGMNSSKRQASSHDEVGCKV